MKIMVETSARHAHVSPQDLETLFGKGAELTFRKELSQPGQYASNEKIKVVGPRGELSVTILGPTRNFTQVELSATEARQIGIQVPVRESGDIKGTPGAKLVGPAGEIDLQEGLIVAKRHIHMRPEEAEQFGVKDKDIVSVKVNTPGRSLTFGDTLVRVHPTFRLTMHIDTDESNAASAGGEVFGELVK